MPLSLPQIAKAVNGRIVGNRVRCPGPGHSRDDDSVSITIHHNGEDVVVTCFSPADSQPEALAWVRERCGVKRNGNGNGNRRADIDLAKLMQEAISTQDNRELKHFTANYPYQDRDGTLLYEVLRYENPKTFRHRQPDGKGGWIYKGSERRVVYRWPDLIKYPDATVVITEGEKDANTVAALEFCATTVASGKWTDDCVNALAGRHCWILQDEDKTGVKKALEAATRLHPVAASVKIVRLPGLTCASRQRRHRLDRARPHPRRI